MTPEFILRHCLPTEKHAAHCGTYKRDNMTDVEKLALDRRMALSELDNLGYAHEYAEPGYTQPKKGILLANWNYFPRQATDILERAGYEIEWQDEWSTCDDCARLFRTSGDSHGWLPYYAWIDDCAMVCMDCIKRDIPSYLESLENKPSKAITDDEINPLEHGYALISDNHENGLHVGMDDNPEEIYGKLKAAWDCIVFKISDASQFYITFEVYGKPRKRWHHIATITEDTYNEMIDVCSNGEIIAYMLSLDAGLRDNGIDAKPRGFSSFYESDDERYFLTDEGKEVFLYCYE